MKALKKAKLQKLDNNRSIIALMVLEGKDNKTISQNLASYWIKCTEQEFTEYIKNKPLDRFELKMAENLLYLKKCQNLPPFIKRK
jgi:hypothetical protein